MIDRAGALREALDAAGGGAGAYPTPYGEVRISRVEIEGETVDVFLEGATEGGDPHFRVVNPPLLIADANGDVLTVDGPHRRDPVAALAYVIGSLGGAYKPKGRRSR